MFSILFIFGLVFGQLYGEAATEVPSIYNQPCDAVSVPSGRFYFSLKNGWLLEVKKDRGVCVPISKPLTPEKVRRGAIYFGPQCDHVRKTPSIKNRFRLFKGSKSNQSRAIKLKPMKSSNHFCIIEEISDSTKAYISSKKTKAIEDFGYACASENQDKTQKKIILSYYRHNLAKTKALLKEHKTQIPLFYLDQLDSSGQQINFSSSIVTPGQIFCSENMDSESDSREVSSLKLTRVNRDKNLTSGLRVVLEKQRCKVEIDKMINTCDRLWLIDLKGEFLACANQKSAILIGLSREANKKLGVFKKRSKDLAKCLCRNPESCPDHLRLVPTRVVRPHLRWNINLFEI